MADDQETSVYFKSKSRQETPLELKASSFDAIHYQLRKALRQLSLDEGQHEASSDPLNTFRGKAAVEEALLQHNFRYTTYMGS